MTNPQKYLLLIPLQSQTMYTFSLSFSLFFQYHINIMEKNNNVSIIVLLVWKRLIKTMTVYTLEMLVQ